MRKVFMVAVSIFVFNSTCASDALNATDSLNSSLDNETLGVSLEIKVDKNTILSFAYDFIKMYLASVFIEIGLEILVNSAYRTRLQRSAPKLMGTLYLGGGTYLLKSQVEQLLADISHTSNPEVKHSEPDLESAIVLDQTPVKFPVESPEPSPRATAVLFKKFARMLKNAEPTDVNAREDLIVLYKQLPYGTAIERRIKDSCKEKLELKFGTIP